MSNNKSKEIFSANLEKLMTSRDVDRNKLCSDLGLKIHYCKRLVKGYNLSSDRKNRITCGLFRC